MWWRYFFGASWRERVECKVDRVLRRVEYIMARVDELKAELVAVNEATNEIAADIQDLLDRLAGGGLTDAEAVEVKGQLEALKTKLQGIAAQHTPPAPAPPQ